MPLWYNIEPEWRGIKVTSWTPKITNPFPAEELGKQVFGSPISNTEAYRQIEDGFEASVLERFDKLFPESVSGVRAALKLSERTLTRRRSSGRFNAEESDRLYRLITLYLQAADVLESAEAADSWMNSPALALGDNTPLAYAQNEAGARQVHDLLVRIDHGVYS